MHVLRQFGALVLLLVTSVAPAMTCMVPDAQMSTQGHACCRMMKNDCGQMEMPVSQGCCQQAPQNVHIGALDTKPVHRVVLTVIWLTAFKLAPPVAIFGAWMERPEYSPPKSPPTTISILRI